MQAFMNEDVALPDGMMAIQVTSSPPSRSGSCLSAVELGKRLLLHSRDGDTDEVKNLISRGAPFTTDWPDGMMAIQVTSSPPSRSGSCLSAVELGKRLLLHSRDGDTDEVKNLISRGAPFTTDWLGTSPLHLAALNGHAETAEVLLRGGISRDARTKVDRTPLHIAAQEGHADIVDLLLSHGAEIESLDMLRMTPLHWAVDRGHTNTVMKLLEHGANPNAVSKFEKTPFVIAIDNNRADLVDMLQNTAVYNTASKDSEEHIENPADEADTAAENLMVISGGATEDDEMEEMESDQSELNVITMGTQNCSSAWSGLTDAESNQYEVVPEAIKINFLNSSDKIKTKAKLKPIVVPGTSTSTAQNSIQFLKAHGITMLPADDSNIVTSAMESGQTVVLTEAGKLALNLTRGIPKNSKKAIASIASSSSKGKRKVVTISAEQLAMLTGTSAKVVPINKQLSFSPARLKVKRINEVPNSSKIITTTTGKRVFPSSSQVIGKVVSEPQVMNVKLEERLEEFIVDTLEDEEEQDTLDDRPTDDLETMERKLAQAKKEAEEYRKQLLQKEQEAEEYLKKLQSLSK